MREKSQTFSRFLISKFGSFRVYRIEVTYLSEERFMKIAEISVPIPKS